jgi:hypothetical protein
VAISGLSEKIPPGSKEKTLVLDNSKFFEQCVSQCVQYLPRICKQEWHSCEYYCTNGLYANRQGVYVSEDGEQYHMDFNRQGKPFNAKCKDNCNSQAKKTCEGDISCQAFCRKEMKEYGFQVVANKDTPVGGSYNALILKWQLQHQHQQQQQQASQLQGRDPFDESFSFWFIIHTTFFLISSVVRIVLCLDIIYVSLNLYQQIQRYSPKGSDDSTKVKFYELLFEVDMKDLFTAKIGGSILRILMQVKIIFQTDEFSLLTLFLFFCVAIVVLKNTWKLYKCYTISQPNDTASTVSSTTIYIGQRIVSLGRMLGQEFISSSSSSHHQENDTNENKSKEKSN